MEQTGKDTAEEIKEENIGAAADADETQGAADNGAAAEESAIAELQSQLEQAKEQAKEANDKYLRMMAEYDNFRKRAQKEREGIYTDAYGDVLKEILPVVDNLERALQFEDGVQLAQGVKMTYQQFQDAMKRLGIEEIETVTFDPNYHNAVMHIEDEAYGEGAVVEVFQKGYKKGEKVLRFAMVKVAN